jgi:CrcB protein
MTALWIFVAGGLGSLARYGVGLLSMRWVTVEFPYGTLAVNVIGCFLIAVVFQISTTALTPTHRLILATGFLGGFTTYSSFNYDTLRFIAEGALGKAAVYFVVTTLACAFAGVAGLWAVR